MLSGQRFIGFTLRPWQSTWKTDQKIMSLLAATNRVLYVDPPRSLHAAVREVVGRMPRTPVLRQIGPSLLVYQEPAFLPAWGRAHPLSPIYNGMIDPLRLGHLRHIVRRHGFQSAILWSFTPLSSKVLGRLGERLVVYHVLDNFDEFFSSREVWHRIVRTAHREMIRRADVVFAVSEGLLEECLKYNRQAYLMPNAVDYEPFEAAVRAGTAPHDVNAIPRPVIGFVGVLHATIDFELLEMVARAHPEWSLMLVGPLSLDAEDARLFKRLCSLANVHYLGGKPPDALPGYVKSCDVGLIPHRLNTYTAFGDPQKLYEYMACGVPVVSTAIPAVRRFQPLVHVADSSADFVAAVGKAVAHPDGLATARKALARENSWEHRVREIGTILARHLAA